MSKVPCTGAHGPGLVTLRVRDVLRKEDGPALRLRVPRMVISEPLLLSSLELSDTQVYEP